MVHEEHVVLDMPFDDALAATKAAFAESGFGTLTEIDVQATLHAKVGKEMDHYVIVGACNPGLASRAIDAEPLIGALLPCNVVVRQVGDQVHVDAMDPGMMASLTGNEGLAPVAAEAEELIRAALQRLVAG